MAAAAAMAVKMNDYPAAPPSLLLFPLSKNAFWFWVISWRCVEISKKSCKNPSHWKQICDSLGITNFYGTVPWLNTSSLPGRPSHSIGRWVGSHPSLVLHQIEFWLWANRSSANGKLLIIKDDSLFSGWLKELYRGRLKWVHQVWWILLIL